MNFIINNDTAFIPPLTEEIEIYLHSLAVELAMIMRLSLCLDELLTNTILYGYEDGNSHEIQINVDVKNGKLWVELIDDATPFDPTRDAPMPDLESPLEDRRIGGLGVHLVRTFVDTMEYCRTEDGFNHLLLVKQL